MSHEWTKEKQKYSSSDVRIEYRLNGIKISKLTSTVFMIKSSILQQENALNESSCGVIFIYYDDYL